MRSFINGLLEGRIIRWGGLLAATLIVAASIAWSDHDQGRVKLGGTWAGKLGDITWTSTWTPDSTGQNATITLQWMTLSVDFEAMLGLLGADHMSMVSGSISMVNPDRAKGKIIWYIVAEGTASTTQPVAGQIKAVAVMTDDFHFTSSSTALGTHELKIYSADPKNPLVPNKAYIFFDQTYEDVPHTRVL
jgi:hypothetical protein